MKKLVACGCSFMTSSFHKYQSIKRSSWPEYLNVDLLDDFSSLKKEIVDDYNYKHNLHFVDLYAILKNFKYINLAHGASSNFLIRIQIDQAIKFKPDF
jgi:catalase (peroxidase I)